MAKCLIPRKLSMRFVVSIVKAKIIQRDTTICKGSSITLAIDSTKSGQTLCSGLQLSTALKNGLVGYFPFCGNANDASGNGNNGNVTGATLTTDRFGNLNSNDWYVFSGISFTYTFTRKPCKDCFD